QPCSCGGSLKNRRRLLRLSVELWQKLRRSTALGGEAVDHQVFGALLGRMRQVLSSLKSSEDAPSRQLAELCQRILESPSLGDGGRLALRGLVLEGITDNPDGGAGAVGLLLVELWIAGDWAGHTETFRRAKLAGYEPNAEDRLGQGEAYCRQALELGPGLVRLWALEQAVSQFHQAAAGGHLAVAKDLILEVRGDAA
ncbi:MAG: hypothetical protein V3T72_13810, partial [Thermoanaerobaculia bacterium]